MTSQFNKSSRRAARPAAQRGIVMIISLIALAILGIAAAAFIRSMDTSVMIAGKLGFRRDLVNQAERGVSKAMYEFSSVSGTLHALSAPNNDLLSSNYSSVRLTENDQGIPKVLLGDSNWTMTGDDLKDSTGAVNVRYVIDRLCTASGAFDDANCSYLQTPADSSGTSQLDKPRGPRRPVYRVTIRVTDTAGTQSYFQSTFSY